VTESIRQLVDAGSRFLVAGHRRPDGDALGAALGLVRGLRALGKDADLFCPDPVPASLAFLVEGEELLRSVPADARWDAAFVTDTAAPELLPGGFPDADARGPLVVVDHHVAHRDFGDHVIRDTGACATGEVVRMLLAELGLESLTPEVALPLYTAVVADTGGFRYASTEARTLRLGAELVDAGAVPWLVAKNLFEGWARQRLDLLREVIGAMRFHGDGRLVTIPISRALLAQTGATDDMIDGLVNYGRSVRGVEVAALLWEQDPPADDGRIRLSLRASGDVDVASIAASFGGGGHHAAAGATIVGKLGDAEARVVDAALPLLDGAAAGG
jgi:phosphoesterase RecJ-like protein